jgi:hypothetical protein
MAADHDISVDSIASKNGADISLPDFVAYDDVTTEIDYIGTERLVPYSVVKSMVDNASGSQVEIPITESPFFYDTGTTDRVPQIRVFLKPDADTYKPWFPDIEFTMSAGIVAVSNLDLSAGDVYSLVIG